MPVKKIRLNIEAPTPIKDSQRSLPASGIFSDLSEDKLKLLASYGEFFYARVGMRVVEQDYFQDSLYFLLSGEFQVSYLTSDERHYLSTVQAGESIGEANLFSPDLATASVYISQDCELWRIDKSQISNFIIAYPQDGLAIVAQIIKLLSQRIKRLNERTSNTLDHYREHHPNNTEIE